MLLDFKETLKKKSSFLYLYPTVNLMGRLSMGQSYKKMTMNKSTADIGPQIAPLNVVHKVVV